MRQQIETAPTDGEFVLLEDDAGGKYAVARWSAEADGWVEENGEPIPITATHWSPMPSEKYPSQEDSESSGPYSAERPASWARLRNLFTFSFRRAARQPTASDAPAPPGTVNAAQDDAIEAQTVWVEAKRVPPMRRRVVALSIIATLVVAALLTVSSGIPDRPAVQQSVSPSQVAQKAYSVAPDSILQPRTDADRTRASANDARQAAEPTAAAQQSPEGEQRLPPLSDELAKAQRTINERNLQLRELANELAIARRENENHVAASTRVAGERAQLKQTADSAAARVRELASELATARREIDAHAALASKAGEQAEQIKQAAESTTTELRQSLQRERDRAEASARDLATARRELDAHAALASKAGDQAEQIKQAAESTTAELRQSLQRERDRAEASARDLATARRELDAHAALASKAGDQAEQIKQAAESTTAELRQSLQQERDRAEASARDLATARREIDAHAALASKAGDQAEQIKQAAESSTAELRQSLQREHDRAEALAQDLATARREIDTHAALARNASDEAAQIKQAAEGTTAELRRSLQQERDKVAALAQELATARREIDTHVTVARSASDQTAQIKQAAESTEEIKRSLQRERAGAEALARDLATARREIDTHAKQARGAGDEVAQIKQAAEAANAELRQALQQERDRIEALTQKLTTARLETDTHAKLWSNAADEMGQSRQVAAELRQSLQQERDRAEALARDLELARRTTDQRIALEPAANGRITQVRRAVETAAAEQPPAAETQDSPDVARLLARASTLLAQGNIGAARIVLERATETGSARASFALAETYDPFILSRWGTYGTRGDAMKARELYAKAHVGGIQEAKDRINALRQ